MYLLFVAAAIRFLQWSLKEVEADLVDGWLEEVVFHQTMNQRNRAIYEVIFIPIGNNVFLKINKQQICCFMFLGHCLTSCVKFNSQLKAIILMHTYYPMDSECSGIKLLYSNNSFLRAP